MKPARCVAVRPRTSALVGVVVTLVLSLSGQVQADAADARTGASGAQLHAVNLLGDSLLWQAQASLEALLTKSRYSVSTVANPGHSLATGWALVQVNADLTQSLAGIVVLETASNDAARVSRGTLSVTIYRNLLDAVLKAASVSRR